MYKKLLLSLVLLASIILGVSFADSFNPFKHLLQESDFDQVGNCENGFWFGLYHGKVYSNDNVVFDIVKYDEEGYVVYAESLPYGGIHVFTIYLQNGQTSPTGLWQINSHSWTDSELICTVTKYTKNNTKTE